MTACLLWWTSCFPKCRQCTRNFCPPCAVDFIPAYGGTSDIVYNEQAKLACPFVFQCAQAVTAISNWNAPVNSVRQCLRGYTADKGYRGWWWMGCFFLGRHIRMTNSPYDPTSSLLRKEGGSFRIISGSLSLTWLLSFLLRFAREFSLSGLFSSHLSPKSGSFRRG